MAQRSAEAERKRVQREREALGLRLARVWVHDVNMPLLLIAGGWLEPAETEDWQRVEAALEAALGKLSRSDNMPSAKRIP